VGALCCTEELSDSAYQQAFVLNLHKVYKSKLEFPILSGNLLSPHYMLE